MKFTVTWIRPFDYVPTVPIAAVLASMSLVTVNEILSMLALVAGLGYTVTKWILLYKQNRRALLHPLTPLPPD